MTADPKPPKVVRDPKLLKELHGRWRRCVLADDTCVSRRSLHHVHKHPRDDVEANLVMLCGDGTTGHHGLIEAHDYQTSRRLGVYLARYRLDTMAYLSTKLASSTDAEPFDGFAAAREWLRHRLYAPV